MQANQTIPIVNYDMLLSKVMLHINWNKYCIWVHCRIYMFDNNPNYNKSKRMVYACNTKYINTHLSDYINVHKEYRINRLSI